jgi:hypothetical protein
MLTFAVKKKRTPSIAPKRHAPTVSPMSHSLHLQQARVRYILRSPTFQPKLTIGQPNDKYEQEADRVADEVMRMPEPHVQRKPEEEKKQEEEGPAKKEAKIGRNICVEAQRYIEAYRKRKKPLTEDRIRKAIRWQFIYLRDNFYMTKFILLKMKLAAGPIGKTNPVSIYQNRKLMLCRDIEREAREHVFNFLIATESPIRPLIELDYARLKTYPYPAGF